MGFFTIRGPAVIVSCDQTQTLSGWDGVFHEGFVTQWEGGKVPSQSLSGWDGVFHGSCVVDSR